MRYQHIFVALLLLSMMWIGTVHAGVTRIYPTSDVQVFNGAGYENYNFGSEDSASAGRISDVTWRLWFKATLPVFTSAEAITGAKLYLYLKGGQYAGGLDSIGAYYATDDSWTENGITWNSAPNNSVSSTADSVVTNQGYNWSQWYSWDIIPTLRRENQGSVISIVLKQTDETVNGAQRSYWMKEYLTDPTLRPYIEITTSSLAASAVVSTKSEEGYTNIQSAIDSLPAEGGTVLIKEGTYTINEPIKVPSQVTLKGMGCNTTKIVTASDSINGFQPELAYNATDTTYIKIMDLGVWSAGFDSWTTGTNVGIDLWRTSNSVVENCIVAGFKKGIWIREDACWYNLISNTWIYSCEDGIMLADAAAAPATDNANENKIEYGRIWNCERGVNFVRGDNVTVFGVSIEAEKQIGIKTNGAYMRIIGNRFESQQPNATAVYVDTSAEDTDIISNLLQYPKNIVDKGKGTTQGDIVATGTMAGHIQRNLVENGSFEDWVGTTPAYWNGYGSGTVAQGEPGAEGTKSVSLTGAIGENYLGQTYTIPTYLQGKTLSLSARVKLVTSAQCDVGIRDTADSSWRTIVTLYAADGTGWRTLYFTFPPKTLPQTTQVEITLYPSGGEVLFDGVMMTSGDVPVGYEGPRFEPTILANKTVNSSQTTIPHGLGRIPSFISIKMKSNGQIWESASADATNIYLQANQNGKICDVYIY